MAATLGKPEEVRVSFRSSPVQFRQCVLVLNQLFLVARISGDVSQSAGSLNFAPRAPGQAVIFIGLSVAYSARGRRKGTWLVIFIHSFILNWY